MREEKLHKRETEFNQETSYQADLCTNALHLFQKVPALNLCQAFGNHD